MLITPTRQRKGMRVVLYAKVERKVIVCQNCESTETRPFSKLGKLVTYVCDDCGCTTDVNQGESDE